MSRVWLAPLLLRTRANARARCARPVQGPTPLPRPAALALCFALACAGPGERREPAPPLAPEPALAGPAIVLDPMPPSIPAEAAPDTPTGAPLLPGEPETAGPAALAALTPPTPDAGLPPGAPHAPGTAEGAKDAQCARIVEIRVDKHRRRLEAICEGGAQVVFPAALGRRSFGSKDETGDLRTPEGVYHVAESARGSTFHLFILLDYPSANDAYRAFEAGRISERTYARIATAHERGELPPQDTLLGGRIGIHGEGRAHQGLSARENWTLGCIALSDAHVEFLADRTAVGTPVRIVSGR